MGFPTKNDQHLGCEMGVPPFKETPIYFLIGETKWIFVTQNLRFLLALLQKTFPPAPMAFP